MSAPYSVTMMGLPCAVGPGLQLGLQPPFGRVEVTRLDVPAVVTIDHDDIGQLGHRARVGEREHHVDEADRPARVGPPAAANRGSK